MPTEEIKEFIRKRPSFFWWTLANLLAAAFAIVSWTTCLYIFNYPEKPANYEILRKLKRLQPVTGFTPSEAPDGEPVDPVTAFKKFFALDDKRLSAIKAEQIRDYLTNYKEPSHLTYVEGGFQITAVRALSSADLFQPGLAVRAQAFLATEDDGGTAPYPVVVELLLPTAEPVSPGLFKVGALLTLNRTSHRATILSAAKLGTPEEPLICLTAVPLSYEFYQATDGTPLPLSAPDPLNLNATFPAMAGDRPPGPAPARQPQP